MTVAHSTKQVRPSKPFPEFPLFAHNNGQWCRKIRGKLYSFGVWADATAALDRHAKEYPYLKAGVPVPDSFDGLTVEQLCNQYLEVKDDQLEAGEISQRWFDDLHGIGGLIVKHVHRDRPVDSLAPDDFAKLRKAIVRKHSPQIARNKISRVKSFFTFAYDNHLIDRPVRYGQAFKPPTKATIRKRRAKQVRKVWTPAQVKRILRNCNTQFKAINLLMLNCGLASSDICNMPLTGAINLKTGWLDYPRPKTGIPRRAKLWPETVKAIKAWLKQRDSATGLMFVTRWGNPWKSTAITHELAKIIDDLKWDHGSPEWWRKTFQTVSEECDSPDFIAIKTVMGHADESMADHYRQRVSDKRLKAVADHLHRWLYGKRGAKMTKDYNRMTPNELQELPESEQAEALRQIRQSPDCWPKGRELKAEFNRQFNELAGRIIPGYDHDNIRHLTRLIGRIALAYGDPIDEWLDLPLRELYGYIEAYADSLDQPCGKFPVQFRIEESCQSRDVLAKHEKKGLIERVKRGVYACSEGDRHQYLKKPM